MQLSVQADFTEPKYGTQNRIFASKFCGVTEQRVTSKTGQNEIGTTYNSPPQNYESSEN
jgi:hypothetical protein